ncbi:MAG TPA: sugar ABC transporter permease [Ktedonobacteraceae bacterium]
MDKQFDAIDHHPYVQTHVRMHITRAHREAMVGLLFVLPAIIPLLIFVIYPMMSALYLSFTNWQLVGAPVMRGGGNYTALFGDGQFLQSLLVTLEISVGTALPLALLAFIVALLLDAHVRFTAWYQPLIFLPTILPTVVTAVVWGMLYQGNGIINVSLGLTIPWLTEARWALPALIFMLIWTNLGYFAVIMLAGVREIPRDYYEAARIDGANSFMTVWHITLPLVRPVLLFVIVIATSQALTLFAQPYLLTQGGPGDATRPLAELIYDTAFSYLNIGKASAMSFVLLVLSLIVVYVQFSLLRTKDVES